MKRDGNDYWKWIGRFSVSGLNWRNFQVFQRFKPSQMADKS
jgi:hypothetical protein